MAHQYIRVDPMLPEHKANAKLGEDYPDGAGFAFVLTLCWASRQSPPGYFANAATLKALLGKRGRWVPFLEEHLDVVEQPDGRLYVPGWAEWQEGQYPTIGARRAAIDGRPKTGKERTAAYRERKRLRDAGGDAVTSSRLGDGDVTPRKGRSHGHSHSFSTLVPDSEPRDPAGTPENGSIDRTNGTKPLPGPEDEELIERDRAILADPTTPDWKREVTLAHLQGLGVHS